MRGAWLFPPVGRRHHSGKQTGGRQPAGPLYQIQTGVPSHRETRRFAASAECAVSFDRTNIITQHPGFPPVHHPIQDPCPALTLPPVEKKTGGYCAQRRVSPSPLANSPRGRPIERPLPSPALSTSARLRSSLGTAAVIVDHGTCSSRPMPRP
ncbi:hypothetical protein CKAH01_03637 [Colletotrichum kahawae]|uniref:Uncharacterized protein n=1 Tax=Colletotrichum kahawae TaxID=34407 RepID=A0AAD9YRH1_COLKA|nr:hypothetical protein CKAH01_03637 [Colletotrichum kahawae]